MEKEGEAMAKKEMMAEENPAMAKEKMMNDGDVTMAKAKMMKHMDEANLAANGLALEGYCPVAYVAVNKPLRGKKEYASTYNGATYYFVSADAQAEFDRNPDKYVPAYGGWCAYGMAVEQKFPVDPTNFKIVDGRVMLFLKNEEVDALDLWNQGDEATLVSKADRFWSQ